VLGLGLRLSDQATVLLEQPARLVAGVLGLVERLPNPVAALVDRLLDRAEGVPLEHEERDPERDQRPDHQPGDGLDEAVVGEGQHWATYTSTKARRPPIRP
jgi:hypothetical protein